MRHSCHFSRLDVGAVAGRSASCCGCHGCMGLLETPGTTGVVCSIGNYMVSHLFRMCKLVWPRERHGARQRGHARVLLLLEGRLATVKRYEEDLGLNLRSFFAWCPSPHNIDTLLINAVPPAICTSGPFSCPARIKGTSRQSFPSLTMSCPYCGCFFHFLWL